MLSFLDAGKLNPWGIDITERRRLKKHLESKTERERSVAVDCPTYSCDPWTSEKILNTTVFKVRASNERIFIYRFEPDWGGVVVAVFRGF